MCTVISSVNATVGDAVFNYSISKETPLGNGYPILPGVGKDESFGRYASSFEEAVSSAVGRAEPGEMILTLGAGLISQLGPVLLEKLNNTSPVART